MTSVPLVGGQPAPVWTEHGTSKPGRRIYADDARGADPFGRIASASGHSVHPGYQAAPVRAAPERTMGDRFAALERRLAAIEALLREKQS
jgi:hypothetical protein